MVVSSTWSRRTPFSSLPEATTRRVPSAARSYQSSRRGVRYLLPPVRRAAPDQQGLAGPDVQVLADHRGGRHFRDRPGRVSDHAPGRGAGVVRRAVPLDGVAGIGAVGRGRARWAAVAADEDDLAADVRRYRSLPPGQGRVLEPGPLTRRQLGGRDALAVAARRVVLAAAGDREQQGNDEDPTHDSRTSSGGVRFRPVSPGSSVQAAQPPQDPGTGRGRRGLERQGAAGALRHVRGDRLRREVRRRLAGRLRRRGCRRPCRRTAAAPGDSPARRRAARRPGSSPARARRRRGRRSRAPPPFAARRGERSRTGRSGTSAAVGANRA